MFICVTGVCRRLGWVLLGAFVLSAQAEEVSATADIFPREVYSGGAATTPVINEKAYSQFAPNLGFVQQGMFRRGDMLFRRTHEGLGPLFNAALILFRKETFSLKAWRKHVLKFTRWAHETPIGFQ
jgi:hypothetical protein